MANYYKITKAQADTLGKIVYAPQQAFDPYVNEQTDGTYLVSEKMYNVLKEHTNFKKLTWGSLTKISDAQVAPKTTDSEGTKTGTTGSK